MQFEEGAQIVRQRSWGLCEVHGSHVGIQTHHRLPRGMGGVSRDGLFVNRPSNLVRVCLAAHDEIEHQREWAYTMGYLVRRGEDPAEIPIWLQSVNGVGWYHLHADGDMRWVDHAPPCAGVQPT